MPQILMRSSLPGYIRMIITINKASAARVVTAVINFTCMEEPSRRSV